VAINRLLRAGRIGKETSMATPFVSRSATVDARPMVEMNTTPLIDVLLVMLIVTIPMQQHVVKLDLPVGGEVVMVERVRNDIGVSAEGVLSWNGQPVTLGQLSDLLERAAAMPAPPEVHLRPSAEARYQRVDEVLGAAKRAHVQTLGFVGNELFGTF